VGGGEDDRAHYGGEVHAADRKLRPLLRAVERKRDVLVVVAGDHGEVLDEEPCGWQHERSSGEGVLRVPLAFAGPGLAPNRRDDVALLVDITPTVLDLLGFPPLAESDGLSLRVPVRRDTWWGESGMCERTCAPGCEPPGLLGRDRVVRGEGWRLVDRPGRGPFVEGRGTPPAPSTWATLLHELPRLEVLPPSASEEQARALGYVEPR
jgi:hypothetical protein